MTQSNTNQSTPTSPFCLRLTRDERSRLERDAAGLSLGAYVRTRLFGDNITPRRTRNKFPVKDHQALTQIIGMLGQSRIANNLNQIARAVNSGGLKFTPELEQIIIEAHAEIIAIRALVMKALGMSDAD